MEKDSLGDRKMKEVELIGKRKLREKHFLQKDGTIRAEIYPVDIHYLKNGKYEEIDNTLVKRKGYYKNKGNDYQVEFKEDYKDSLMKMKKDKHYIDFKLESSNINNVKLKKKKLSKTVVDVSYNGILDDIDIEYKMLSNKVKETIVLKKNNYSKLKFYLDTNLDLKEEKGEVIATNNKEIIFTIDKPYMIDANGVRNDNVYYKLQKREDNYLLDLILDEEWLNKEDTKFPVSIDPTISNNQSGFNFYDTFIYPGDTNDNRSNLGYLIAGVQKVNNQSRINRTLIKFDLPTIGTGYEIVDASIDLIPYLGYRNVENIFEHLVEVHRVTANWTESGANWNNMHDKYDSRVEYITPTHRSALSDNNTIVTYPVGMDITGLVKKWYEDTPNYGIMIKSCNEAYTDEDYPMFFSNNNTVNGNPKPIFTIQYRNQNGLESYWDYKEQSFTDGSSYINTHTGNLTTAFKLGNTIGGAMPASLSLIYNTNDVILNQETFFGKGFRLNLEQTIEKIENGFQYQDEDGTIHYFYKKEPDIFDSNKEPDGFYYDEDGLNLKIEDLDILLKMTDLNNNQMLFSKKADKYYLISIQDTDGNTISLKFNNNNSIDKIIDKYHNEINIEYNDNNIVITSSDQTKTKLNYTNHKLTSMESINGITTFHYNSNHILSSIVDVTGLKTEYEYYEKIPYRMKKVTGYGLDNALGRFYTLEYSLYETTIKDNNGLIETIAFNNYGNATSRSILKGQGEIEDAYSIEKSFDDKNKLTSSMIPNKYIKNYLKNTSFESDINLFTTESGITTSFDTENMNSGLRSLKVESIIPKKSIEQTITIKKGEYYTFSGYFKNDIPLELSLSYSNTEGKEIKSIETVDSLDEFEREDVTIFYGEDATSDLKIKITLPEVGTIYLDDIQLEKGEVANSYNIIENSDFKEGLTGWDCSASLDDKEVNPNSYISVVDVNNNTKAVKVNMQYNLRTLIEKKYNIKGIEGDAYTISFWFKNEATSLYAPGIGSNVTIFYEPYNTDNGHCILSYTLPITNGESWQHFVYTDKSIEDFKSVFIRFHTYGSANNFLVTDLSFYKNVTRGEYYYDDNGNLVSTIDQSNNTNVFKYDKNNQLISMTNPLGKEFKYEYDNSKTDRVLSAIASNGISNRVIYDSKGNPITTKISRKYTKEIVDGLYKIRNKGTNKYLKAELSMVLLEENECSNTIWKLEKVGDYYKIFYSIQPEYSISCRNGQLTLDKEDTNNLFQLEKNTDSKNGTYYIKYLSGTSTGGEVKFLTVNGVTIEAKPFSESSSNIEFYIELTDELFIENDATYTEDGRFVASVVDSSLNKVEYETDSTTGQLLSITNQNNLKTSYSYNDKRQRTTIVNEDRKIQYEYNDKNLLSKVIHGSTKYSLDYDDFLNIKEIKVGDTVTLVENEYENNNGNLKSMTYGNNDKIVFDYDEFNRIKKDCKMDNNYLYKYDNNGNLSKIISNNGIERYYYDTSNRLCKYKNNHFIIKYSYNKDDDVTNKKYNLNNVTHTLTNQFNADNIITKIVLDNDEITYQYDSLDRVINKKINDNFEIKFNYYKRGKRATTLVDSMEFLGGKYFYLYDNMGNITHQYYNNQLYKEYKYNKFNELIKEVIIPRNEIIEYSYDSLGNLLTKTTKDLSTDEITNVDTYNYNNNNNNNWEDQLTNYNGKSIIYDAIGNPINIGNNIIMNWINGRFLNTYIDSINNLNIQYQYNNEGIRVSKNINGVETKYYVEDNDIVYEKRNNNLIYYLYDLTGVAGLIYNENTYYYIKNFHNDIIGILDSNYNKIVTYEYDSWGKVLSIKDNNGNIIEDNNHIGIINPYRYRSYYYDSETQLYYLNSRYYNPEWKRFINADGIIDANEEPNRCNLYAYACNNPISFYDADGNFALSLSAGTLAGALLLGTAAVIAAKAASKALSMAASAARSKAQTRAKSKTSQPKKSNPPKSSGHYVYVLEDRNTKQVEYVGRTTNKDATKYRHKRNPARKKLDMHTIAENVSYEAARGLEQMWIIECNTLKRDPQNPIHNQINGVNPLRDEYFIYWAAAGGWVSDNESLVPCR